MKNSVKILIALLLTGCALQGYAQTDEKLLTPFYKHLRSKMKYPATAKSKGLQGNSLVTFNIAKGRMSNLKLIETLGGGCDGEVVNEILAFGNFYSFKDGNYALKTRFSIEGSHTVAKNELINTPKNHQLLNMVVVGYAPSDLGTGDSHATIVIKSKGYNLSQDGKHPLIILDSTVITHHKMKNIDPNNIESVQVFKNEAVISGSGKTGDNGVIVITSKSKCQIIGQGDSKTSNNVQVKVAGVNLASDNGKETLYVLDGEIITKDGMKALNPNQIKSIEVLKDSAAIMRYGLPGANGVVLITTKTAQEKPKN